MQRVVLATWVALIIIYAVRQQRRTRHNAGHSRADSFHIDAKTEKATKSDQREINHMHMFMDKLGYTLYSTRPSRQRGDGFRHSLVCI